MIDYSNGILLEEKYQSQIFDYTGDVLKIYLLAGIYKFECAGGRGGNAHNPMFSGVSNGAYGSCVSSDIYLSENLDLYCYIGGKGADGNSGASGWNGGGWGGGDNRGFPENGTGGGGATDVRLIPEDLKSRIIVAGGGGGAGGWRWCHGNSTPVSNGVLGQGSHGGTANSGQGGGGGGYYGGACNSYHWDNDSYVGNGAYSGTNYADPNYCKNTTIKIGTNSDNGYLKITCLNLLDIRKNSNFYKNINPQEAFDLASLF